MPEKLEITTEYERYGNLGWDHFYFLLKILSLGLNYHLLLLKVMLPFECKPIIFKKLSNNGNISFQSKSKIIGC